MKGTYFLGRKTFETREMGPLHPGPGEVLVRVRACGVCGTDVHIYHGEKGSASVTPPVILGHEFAGEVAETGSGVDALRVGDHVTVDPNIYCGRCVYCRTGKKQLCTDMRAVGVTQDGGFSEYCLVPQAQCLRLAPGVPFRFGAMAEPLACCLHGIDRAGIRHGDSVCVIGGGAIGLLMVQLAKLAGAATVLLSEPVEMRRKIGHSLGADTVLDPLAGDLTEAVRKQTGGEGADVVIECVGKVSAARQAVDVSCKGGTILLFSVPAVGAELSLDLFAVYQKELTIRGSFVNPDTHLRAVELLDHGRLTLDPILTHSFPLERVEDAILTQMGDQSIKVLVEP